MSGAGRTPHERNASAVFQAPSYALCATPTVSSLEEAYAACLRLCRSHYENFPVASRWIPARFRAPIAVVYAFARTADDFADEPGLDSPERLRLLADWRRRLRSCRQDHGGNAVFWALADVLDRFALPLQPFEDLITAFEMDVNQTRFKTFDDLLFYCKHSANPVGELVLRIFGEWTESRGKMSDDICTALQLANFWQDVTVDREKDRLYIPLEDLKTMGVSESQAMQGPVDAALIELMAFQVDRAWALFSRGKPLCDEVSASLRKELRFVWLGGTHILEKIEKQRWDVWSRRPHLTKWDWLRLAPRCLLWSAR